MNSIFYDFYDKKLKSICGVYAIVNMEDKNKFYVGYSTDIYKRTIQYTRKSIKNRKHIPKFILDYNNGIKFCIQIIEICKHNNVAERENYWIQRLSPYYNRTKYYDFPQMSLDQIKCFWSRVDMKDIDKCWVWTGGCNSRGYGRINLNYIIYLSHRISYFLTYGYFNPGNKVLHICNNPVCCNPKHLQLGNDKDNAIDTKNNKNYKPHSSKNKGIFKCSRETIEEMIKMKNNGKSFRDISKIFNIYPSSICRIFKKLKVKYIKNKCGNKPITLDNTKK